MRKNWDEYFMGIAKQVATRATCDRKHVGAVIVHDRNILSTGYNGSLPGQPHCDDVGHMMEDGHCVRTNHAEANAICQAAKHGANIAGADIYVTASPCWPCFKLIASSGIQRIIFGELYRDERIAKFARDSKIELVWLENREQSDNVVSGTVHGKTESSEPNVPQISKRCGHCDACELERMGCGCDGAVDDGCFVCTPETHSRPPCPK